MFKIIPLVVSFVLASSGALAVSAVTYFSDTPDTYVPVTAQNNVSPKLQDDSDLFLSANTGHGLELDDSLQNLKKK